MADPQSKFVITAEDRATATLKKVSSEFGMLGRSALSAAATLTTFGGALSLGALAAQVKSVADLQDQFGKMSQQLGIGVQSLTELDYAAKLSDVSTEELQAGVTRLTSKMGDVAQGSKEAAAVFDSLGVKVKNTDGSLRSSEEVLKDIAQRFSEFKDGSTKTAFAVELFGRSGAKLIPMLNAGRDGLAEMAEEARRLGIVFDEKAAKAAEQFNDNLTRLGQAAQGLKIELLQGLIPSLTEVTQRFLDARREGLAFGDALDIAANIEGFGTLDEKIADVQRRLEGAKSGQWTGLFSNDVKGLQAELDKLLKLKARVFGRETAGYEQTIDYSAFGKPLKSEPKMSGQGKAGAAPKLPQAELTVEQQLIVDAGKLFQSSLDSTVGAAKKYQLALTMLDEAYQDGKISLDEYDAAMQKLQATSATAGDAAYDSLKKMADGWLDQLDPMREFTRNLEQVEQMLSRGLITPEQAEAIKKRMSEALQPVSEADAWAAQAAKNIQDALGDTLYNALDGNFEDIGKSFGNMLKRMVAEATAANLARSLFGDYAKTGAVGGIFGSLFSGLLDAGLSMRADGGDIFAGRPYLVGERGPEVIVPNRSAYVVPNHQLGGKSVQITQTNYIGSGVSRSDVINAMTVAKEQAKREVYESMRRGGVFA